MTASRHCSAIVLAMAVLGTSSAHVRSQDDKGSWGSVRGRIVWREGETPPMTLEVEKDSKGVRWAFVWLAPADERVKVPVHPSLSKVAERFVHISLDGSGFRPRCLGLRVGQDVTISNLDAVARAVRWDPCGSDNPAGATLIPNGGRWNLEGLRASSRLPISLSLSVFGNRDAAAYLHAFDHPYWQVTDADGQFELKQAPAGSWQLYVWHPDVGWRGGKKGRNGEKISIRPGQTTVLDALPLNP